MFDRIIIARAAVSVIGGTANFFVPFLIVNKDFLLYNVPIYRTFYNGKDVCVR